MWLTATFKPLPPGSHLLDVEGGSGDGVYPTGTMVTVSADPPPAGQEFAGWAGDITILSNPFLATTTAIIPSMNVIIAASYSDGRLARQDQVLSEVRAYEPNGGRSL